MVKGRKQVNRFVRKEDKGLINFQRKAVICERKIMSKKKKVINFIGGKHCCIRLYSVGGKQRVG